MSIMSSVIRQFQHPHGFMGHVAGWIMANRSSNRERNLWILDLLEIESHHRVLEIGFGLGYAIEQLVPKLSTGKIVGVDHSEMMCYQAAQRNAKAIQSGMVELHCLSVEALNTLKQPFDRIFSANVAQFWPDRVAVYQDILAL